MAYGVKYELIFNNIYVQDPSEALSAYRLRILKKNYIGVVFPLKGDITPIVIETIDNEGNSFTPIIATRATVNVIVDDNFDLIEFMNPYEDEYTMTLEIGSYSGSFSSSKTIWRGVFTPVENVNFNVVGIRTIALVFIDGLSRLKNSKLYFSTDNLLGYLATSGNTIIQYISECLRITNLTLDIWVNEYYKTNSVPYPNIDNITIKRNFFASQPGQYYTHYEVLEMLCRLYGWELYQEDDHWLLESYGSVTRESTYTYYVYTYLGIHGTDQSGTYNSSITVDNTNDFKQISESLNVTLNRGKSSLKLINPINNIAGMANGFFQSWAETTPDGFTVFGSPVISKYDTNGGLKFTSYTTNEANFQNFIYSDNIVVKSGDCLNISWIDSNYIDGHPRYRIVLTPTDTAVLTQFLDSNANWNGDTETLSFFSSVSSTWKNAITVPYDGILRVYIYEPYWNGIGTPPDFIVTSFLVNLFGINTRIFNYDAIQTEVVENSSFNNGIETFMQGPYFMQTALEQTIPNNSTYNDISGFATSYYIGTLTSIQSLAVIDHFGRKTYNTYPLFELVYQDIGIDELQTQYVLDGDFKSKGYWINRKFNYDFTGTGDYVYNYLLKYFKWDVKGAAQSSKLNRINFEGTSYPFVQNPIILKLK